MYYIVVKRDMIDDERIPTSMSLLYKQGSEQALCSLFIAMLFPGWVCLPHLQFWLRLNGGHISRSGFGAKLCFMTCHNFMTYSVMFLINSVKGDFDFK